MCSSISFSVLPCQFDFWNRTSVTYKQVHTYALPTALCVENEYIVIDHAWRFVDLFL